MKHRRTGTPVATQADPPHALFPTHRREGSTDLSRRLSGQFLPDDAANVVFPINRHHTYSSRKI